MATTPSLFADDPPQQIRAPDGPVAMVAIEQSLDKLLDYAIPRNLESSLRVGQRVMVPLGRNNRPARGYVVNVAQSSVHPTLKTIRSLDDRRVLLNPNMLELARWMSRYYCAPLGTVIDSIIPSAVKRMVGIGHVACVRAMQSPEQLQALLEKTKAPKRRAILARLLQLEPEGSIELLRLANESGATPATVRKLAKPGIIRIEQVSDPGSLAREPDPSVAAAEQDLVLNADQQRAFDSLSPRVDVGTFSVTLLHGVTGSGKTEIYLQCIRRVIDAGRQAIVLVPEIALTPQTTRRFTARFGRVAVLHSGLSATQRHSFWQQIAAGQADVVVGARSAVFAPTPNLGMIVVDEEHESSYKQDTAPRYHARDVAIKRAQIENVPVLLG
ncbi:MAG: DEAD/DEAH box helicase, partial [Tepidisphaeraceae bacterium]